MRQLENLCYNIGDMAMFMHEADLQGVDIVKKWHDDPNSRVMYTEEAGERLLAYVDFRGDEQSSDVDVYGAATEAGQREHEEERKRHVSYDIASISCSLGRV
jgi:hypothetical protein